VEKEISLTDALCGYKFTLEHLDGRQLLVSANDGEVVQPGQFKAIFDEGMPDWHRSYEKGKLYIHFKIKFPEAGDVADEDIKVIEKVLGPRTKVTVDMDACEEVTAHTVDMEQEMKRQQQREQERMYEEEDEDMGGGGPQRVQCAQQ